MLDIGFPELLLLVGIIVVVLPPKEIPGALRKIGKALGAVQRTLSSLREQIMREDVETGEGIPPYEPPSTSSSAAAAPKSEAKASNVRN